MLESDLHWETCRCVTRPMRQAIDVESPSWMLELMPPVGVLWSGQCLVVFPLLLSALGLLSRSWGLLMPVCWLLLFQLGCDRVHRLRNLVLAIWSSLNSSRRCSMPVGRHPSFFFLHALYTLPSNYFLLISGL